MRACPPPLSGTIWSVDDAIGLITVRCSLEHTTTTHKLVTLTAKNFKISPSNVQAPVSSPTLVVTSGAVSPSDVDGIAAARIREYDARDMKEREAASRKAQAEAREHYNPHVSEDGMACFNRLLKACNEVAWTTKSHPASLPVKNPVNIIVMNEYIVEEPYGEANVTGTGEGAERIRRVVRGDNEGR